MRCLARIGWVAVLALASCASWKTVENPTPADPSERVEAVVPAPVEAMTRVLLELPRPTGFQEEMKPEFPRLSDFLVAAAGDPTFPDDGAIRVNLDRAPWMETYLALPAQARASDVYLYSVMDLFWASDYRYDGGPAPFYSDFIVHLEAVSESETRVEVFEYLPRIWIGESLQLGAHGPCMCRDQRWVTQTAGDRRALLERLRAAAGLL